MAVTLADIVAMIRGDNTDLKSKLSESEKASQSAGANMAKFLGGAVVAGAALAGTAIIGIGSKAFDVASQIDAATDQIGASLGLTDDQARAFGETIKRVYGNNFGDSIGDVGAAVENVAKQLSLTANDPALAKMTENGFRLRDGRGSYGIGLETFALGFPIHFDWAWKTLFNKEWEDALFAPYGGSSWFREPKFSVWIGYDF